MGIETEYITSYSHAVRVFEFTHANVTTDPNRIVADFEKIVKKHFKEIDKETLAEIMAMPFKYWEKLASLYTSKKRKDNIELSEMKELKPLT